MLYLNLPDKNGKIDNCVLGFDSIEEYDRTIDKNPFFGATVGRTTGRISGGCFTLPGNNKIF